MDLDSLHDVWFQGLCDWSVGQGVDRTGRHRFAGNFGQAMQLSMTVPLPFQ